MCLYPKLILNRKYTPTTKNNGLPPQIKDTRTKFVPVKCGKCMECKKQNARGWQIRLHEEIRNSQNCLFVTLSFSDKSLLKLGDIVTETTGIKEGYLLDNAIAKLAVRRFLERWRKKYKTSIRHWLVTELGQNNTERLHIHGLLFTNRSKETIVQKWEYGNVWIGDYVTERTINYIVKYIYKPDPKHKYYNPIILCSPGLGKNYINRHDSKINKFSKSETNETYTTRQGLKLSLPIYYRNKIYTEEEREILWLQKLDKEERWINGHKIDISYRDWETDRKSHV